MFRSLTIVALMAVGPPAMAQKPPAPFPGSAGYRSGEYQWKLMLWQQQRYQQQLNFQQQQYQQQQFRMMQQQQSFPPLFTGGAPADPPLRKVGEVTAADLSSDIEKLEASVQEGLGKLQAELAELEKDRATWGKLDKTIKTARLVNDGILKRTDALLAVYDHGLEKAVTKLREKLKTAPATYRALAADRKTKADASVLAIEQEAYLSQVELCEAAAKLCEKRLNEIFSSEDPKKVSLADTLGESMTHVRRMQKVHQDWVQVLAAWPNVLDDPNMEALMKKLNANLADMQVYQKNVDKLNLVMKAKANEGSR